MFMSKSIINPNLTNFQKEVMFNQSTEPAYSGEYDDFYQDGDYACRNCGALLYSSSAKFDAGCGWPAFDKCYPNSVIQVPDVDGRRIEIVCSNCRVHLGHVFIGEQLTPQNTRHCVNSASIKYVSKAQARPVQKIESLVVGCGCFWGVEYWFKKLNGVVSTSVGYSGGHTDNPTYRQVCSGKTGHIEVLKIDYDGRKVSFEELIRYFFNIHDFEQADGQGNDVGSQYLSLIQYKTPEQKTIIQKILTELEQKGYKPVTKLLTETKFWPAEDYHQDYYTKNGQSPYCHFYKKIV